LEPSFAQAELVGVFSKTWQARYHHTVALLFNRSKTNDSCISLHAEQTKFRSLVHMPRLSLVQNQ
jgi:hypothetical protein